jgi:hypothetical protein
MRASERRAAAAATLSALALLLLAPAPASAKVRTVHMRFGPITLQAAELKFHNTRVRAPRVNGFITRMHAFVVDGRGRPVASNRVMLHHAVFRRYIKPYYDSECHVRRDSEPFYATGEENETLKLPPGYGLRVKRSDHWLLKWMLMNHTDSRHRVFIRYNVRVNTSPVIAPVRPAWMRVLSCRIGSFNVPGNGGPGSVFTQTRNVPVSGSGRIVVATGHLHGGAIGLTLSEPSCEGRTLVNARPVYRTALPAPYDGPVHVTSFTSPVGIPVFQGEVLGLTATYDNSIPHDHVMGTLHVYVAPNRPSTRSCGPVPPNRDRPL